MQLTGIDDFPDELNALTDHVEGVSELGLDDVFPDSWIESHTEYDSIQDFIDAGFDDRYDAFTEIPRDELDRWVDRETQFSDWDEMQTEAGQAWLQQQVGL